MRSLLFIAIVSSAAACSPYDPDLGPSPFLCGPADQAERCPDGYTCTMMGTAEYCLAQGGSVPVDASNLNCADDSSLEPNDSIQTAFQTPVATQKNSLMFAGLAICPAGDVDNYGITITVEKQNLEMIIEYDAGGADLQGAILGPNGTPIANAAQMTGVSGSRRAYAPNLPAGNYYAKVLGASTAIGNYKLTVNVTGLGMTGLMALDVLNEEFDIQSEMATLHNVLLIVTLGNDQRDLDRVVEAFKKLSDRATRWGTLGTSALPTSLPMPSGLPEGRITPRDAFFAQTETIPFETSAGRVRR
jgi:hypothetical protein